MSACGLCGTAEKAGDCGIYCPRCEAPDDVHPYDAQQEACGFALWAGMEMEARLDAHKRTHRAFQREYDDGARLECLLSSLADAHDNSPQDWPEALREALEAGRKL